MSLIKQSGLLLVYLFAASGCHLIVGPDDKSQDTWYYCNKHDCYRCNSQYCEIPGKSCSTKVPCPDKMTCDTASGTCYSDGKCSISKDCDPGKICVSGACQVARTPCQGDASCGDGAYCANGSCQSTGLCKQPADCAAHGANYTCDLRGTCVPGAPQPTGCASSIECQTALCLDGGCFSCTGDCGGGRTCQFNSHCGPARVCLDGQCTGSCATDADCGTGLACASKVCVPKASGTCKSATDCGQGSACLNGNCYATCSDVKPCANPKDRCSDPFTSSQQSMQICRADHTAKLECKASKDCQGGETCVSGVCRTVCNKTEDCAVCNDGPVCGPGGYCMTAKEAAPKCTDAAQCPSGQHCLDGQCAVL